MPKTFTKTTFNTTYKDDFTDSDHYHRILFNSGKALQARELTQAQTITQKELERLGRHIFKEGSVVLPGGLTVDTNFEFVKLSFTSTTGFAVGDTLTGQTSSIQAKLLKIVAADGSDPVTFYVKYTSTSSGTSGSDPIIFSVNDIVNVCRYDAHTSSKTAVCVFPFNQNTGQSSICFIKVFENFRQSRFIPELRIIAIVFVAIKSLTKCILNCTHCFLIKVIKIFPNGFWSKRKLR